jgi:uncharacterized protein (TIGR03086 family)
MTPAETHRRVAGVFTERVRGTGDWDAPAPVDGWVARDIVRHLVTWFPGFLHSRGLPTLPGGPGLDGPDHRIADPVAAWQAQVDGVQALLEGPDAGHEFDDPFLGHQRLGELIDRIYTGDVFLHTWDLARATGQDDTLDPERCAVMLAGMEPIEDVMRSSGQYGPRVDVPADADVQTRLLGFIGRDPGWRSPS